MCPHCGFDLAKDQPIILNDFSMLSPIAPLCYRGQPLNLTSAARTLCWTLMKSFPRPVRQEVILDRLDSEALGNVVDVYLSRIRRELRRIGAPIPFEKRRGVIAWKLVS
jgi:DNA-binding response OmpR family regulator